MDNIAALTEFYRSSCDPEAAPYVDVLPVTYLAELYPLADKTVVEHAHIITNHAHHWLSSLLEPSPKFDKTYWDTIGWLDSHNQRVMEAWQISAHHGMTPVGDAIQQLIVERYPVYPVIPVKKLAQTLSSIQWLTGAFPPHEGAFPAGCVELARETWEKTSQAADVASSV